MLVGVLVLIPGSIQAQGGTETPTTPAATDAPTAQATETAPPTETPTATPTPNLMVVSTLQATGQATALIYTVDAGQAINAAILTVILIVLVYFVKLYRSRAEND